MTAPARFPTVARVDLGPCDVCDAPAVCRVETRCCAVGPWLCGAHASTVVNKMAARLRDPYGAECASCRRVYVHPAHDVVDVVRVILPGVIS